MGCSANAISNHPCQSGGACQCGGTCKSNGSCNSNGNGKGSCKGNSGPVAGSTERALQAESANFEANFGVFSSASQSSSVGSAPVLGATERALLAESAAFESGTLSGSASLLADPTDAIYQTAAQWSTNPAAYLATHRTFHQSKRVQDPSPSTATLIQSAAKWSGNPQAYLEQAAWFEKKFANLSSGKCNTCAKAGTGCSGCDDDQPVMRSTMTQAMASQSAQTNMAQNYQTATNSTRQMTTEQLLANESRQFEAQTKFANTAQLFVPNGGPSLEQIYSGVTAAGGQVPQFGVGQMASSGLGVNYTSLGVAQRGFESQYSVNDHGYKGTAHNGAEDNFARAIVLNFRSIQEADQVVADIIQFVATRVSTHSLLVNAIGPDFGESAHPVKPSKSGAGTTLLTPAPKDPCSLNPFSPECKSNGGPCGGPCPPEDTCVCKDNGCSCSGSPPLEGSCCRNTIDAASCQPVCQATFKKIKGGYHCPPPPPNPCPACIKCGYNSPPATK